MYIDKYAEEEGTTWLGDSNACFAELYFFAIIGDLEVANSVDFFDLVDHEMFISACPIALVNFIKMFADIGNVLKIRIKLFSCFGLGNLNIHKSQNRVR